MAIESLHKIWNRSDNMKVHQLGKVQFSLPWEKTFLIRRQSHFVMPDLWGKKFTPVTPLIWILPTYILPYSLYYGYRHRYTYTCTYLYLKTLFYMLTLGWPFTLQYTIIKPVIYVWGWGANSSIRFDWDRSIVSAVLNRTYVDAYRRITMTDSITDTDNKYPLTIY